MEDNDIQYQFDWMPYKDLKERFDDRLRSAKDVSQMCRLRKNFASSASQVEHPTSTSSGKMTRTSADRNIPHDPSSSRYNKEQSPTITTSAQSSPSGNGLSGIVPKFLQGYIQISLTPFHLQSRWKG